MTSYALSDIAAGLVPFAVDPEAPAAMPQDSFRILGLFNQCMVGVIRFQGRTAWERHPDDELLIVLDGAVELSVKQGDRIEVSDLHAGETCVVPRDCWHSQYAPTGVALTFLTSQSGNEHAREV